MAFTYLKQQANYNGTIWYLHFLNRDMRAVYKPFEPIDTALPLTEMIHRI